MVTALLLLGGVSACWDDATISPEEGVSQVADTDGQEPAQEGTSVTDGDRGVGQGSNDSIDYGESEGDQRSREHCEDAGKLWTQTPKGAWFCKELN
jgi:hypothetical protein